MNFKVLDVNPNEEVGGGGCLTGGDEKREDCEGPYVVFPQVSTDSNISPHAVLCAACARAIVKAIDTPPEPVIEIDPADVQELDDDIPMV